MVFGTRLYDFMIEKNVLVNLNVRRKQLETYYEKDEDNSTL